MAFLLALCLASPLAGAAAADSGQVQLQLDVRMNGYPLNLVAAFVRMPDGKIGSPRSELAELGVAVPGTGAPEEVIVLDSLPGVSYVYDEAGQSIEIELPNATRLARTLDASRGGTTEITKAESSNGLVINYTAFASADYKIPDSRAAADGGSLSLDARAFSKFGTLRQTAILGTTTFSDFTALRLDTNWTYSDPDSMRTYRLGDIVSGGLSWTRPVRLGGAQVQRNFSLRPDLITMPLPQLAGSAEVPSTLQVFIDGTQAYASDVQPGPFRLDSLPVYTTSGTARMVLTDSTGREIDTEQQFYTSPDLLKKNLYDFSLEGGVVRRNFGTAAFGYDTSPVGLASARYGVSDIFTAEAHGEGSAGLIDVGAGGLLLGGRFGMFSAATAGSLYKGDMGAFVHAGWEDHIGDFGVSVTSSRTIGKFFDLAAATALPADGVSQGGVPKALDQISLTYAFRQLKSGVGLSFINQLASDNKRSLIVSGSYSQSFGNSLTAFVTGFADFGDTRGLGAFVGFSMPFGEDISTSAGMSVSNSGWTADAEASRTSDGTPGSYGWRVSHGEGDQSYTTASGTYHSSKGTVQGHLTQQDQSFSGNAAFDGSAVLAGGGLFLGNQIYDSFAVVDAGAPNVSVEYENRFAGKTDSGGRLLLPDLRSFQNNKISIDVTDLPLTAVIPESETIVVPRDMSGGVVDFGVKAEAPAALVILTDAKGNYLPESSEVTLEGLADPFLMGYDGQVYITGLAAENKVTVKLRGNQCQASFSYKPDNQNQTTIGPLQCL